MGRLTVSYCNQFISKSNCHRKKCSRLDPFMIGKFNISSVHRNVWVDALNWKNPATCTNSACTSKNYTWNNGALLENDVFPGGISLSSGGPCWYYQSSGAYRRLASTTCHNNLHATCQMDCRPGNYV